MEFTGTIKRIGSTVQVSEKFKKREVIITDNHDQYPQIIQFEFTQDRVDSLDNVAVGDEVKINFNLKGREWKSKEGEMKVFNTLQAFAVTKIKASEPKQSEDVPNPKHTDTLPF